MKALIGAKCWCVVLFSLAAANLTMGAASAAELRDAGRQLVAKYQQAVVTVRVTMSIKASMGGQQSPENELKVETSGTVIAPDGLTLIPLAAVDPAGSTSRADDPDRKVDTQVKDVKIMLAGQKEIPATVVLRDKDLSIAFVRPSEKPSAPMQSIDLANASDVNMLDQVLVLARMGRVADRVMGAMSGEIQAIVTKPRKFYVPSAELASGGLGVPIFTADAKLVGFVMLRVMPGAGEDDVRSLMGESGSAMPIIMPASQIAEIAKQAPEKGEVPKKN